VPGQDSARKQSGNRRRRAPQRSRFSRLILVALLATGPASAWDDGPGPPRLTPPPGVVRASVVDVPRANEVRVDTGAGVQVVRLAGVALPPVGPQRDAAIGFLRRLLAGESVRLQRLDSRDDRRPSRGLLFREPDGLCVNLELVRLGYVRARLSKDLPGREAFVYYERGARRAGKGIWAARTQAASRPARTKPGLVAIDAPRARVAANDPVVYVTKTGRKYHRAGCPHLHKSRIARRLSEVAGRYEPCRRCRPPVPDRDRAAPASQPHKPSVP